MTYTCIIVDDEPIAHGIISDYVAKILNLRIEQKFFSADKAIDWLKDHTVDILLLDVSMPEIDGLQLLRSLPNKPITIMTTGHREFALEGFELGVLDYLLKPISFDRFNTAILRAIDFLDLRSRAYNLVRVDERSEKTSFTIKSGTKLISLDLSSITHIQGLKDYAIFFCNEKKYVVKGNVKTIEGMLPPGHFTRVHKSFIVANLKIRYFHRNKIEFDNYQIPVGRIYRHNIDKFFE
jgi:DNA-binding LytR/AlgR family response regulator